MGDLFDIFSSCADISFWSKYSELKLNEYKLDTLPKELIGYYNNKSKNGKNFLNIDSESFGLINTQLNENNIYGTLHHTNTLHEYKSINYNKLIIDEADKIKELIDKKDYSNINKFNRFIVLLYADLKTNKFTYWFGFPSFKLSNKMSFTSCSLITSDKLKKQLSELENQFSIAKIVNNEIININVLSNENIFDDDSSLIFRDSSPDVSKLSWTLRNILIALVTNNNIKKLNIISIKNDSKVFVSTTMTVNNELLDFTKIVGWEKNNFGKATPRTIDLSSTMNPLILVKNSADLNLKLMKWRQWQTIDLEVISKQKCLLLGAGTLGCSVARGLLAWGITKITFLDNGRVSYSNPLRQNLFNYEDSTKRNFKAEAAACNMKNIYPLCEPKSYVNSIPMPGHYVKEESTQITKDIELLYKLIEENDVIFLLTDSRESRYLPILFSTYQKKLCINIALSFDSFQVMRCGRSIHTDKEKMGCYYCVDATSLPTDSMTNKPLDLMCTVTRPGLANYASSIGVEMFIDILQKEKDNVPQQVRGSIETYQNNIINSVCYDKCACCSNSILEYYEKYKLNFINNLLLTPNILDGITGLDKVKESADKIDFDIDDDTDL